MTTQTEALKLSLEALEDRPSLMKWQMARDAVKEALAQPEQESTNLERHKRNVQKFLGNAPQTKEPEQEPVAWLQIGLAPLHDGDVIARTSKPTKWNPEWWKFEPLYTTLPQRKPLTDEEIMNIAKVSCIGISPHEDTLNFAKVIEAAHGIKE
jgi:hypothetical protein